MKIFSATVVTVVGAAVGAALTYWCLWTAIQVNLLNFFSGIMALFWIVPGAAIAGGAMSLWALRSKTRSVWVPTLWLSVVLPLGFVTWASRLDLDSPTCGSETLQSVKSPDGRYVAMAFERDCGATTRANTTVVVYPSEDLFPKNPDRWERYTVYNCDGVSRLGLRWAGPRRLTIERGHGHGQVYLERLRYDKIMVSYRDTGAMSK